MKLQRLHLLLIAIMVASLPALASAEEKPNLVLTLEAHKQVIVKDEEGKTWIEWKEVDSTDPGDVLKYTVTYTNEGKIEARDAVIVDPIPAGTVYVSDSAEGKDSSITYSLDGKAFQSAPLLRYKVKQSDGSEVEYKATPDMYTHIKWKLAKPVPAGGVGTVSFKVKVK